ncbi:MAG: efflux RND transporter periplasmic adaptor subunit, partial [Bryobacteraceae bacterium]
MTRIFLLLTLLAAACSRRTEPGKAEAAVPPQPIAIRVARAETRQIERSIFVTGSLHPDESVSVSSEVAGRLEDVPADFGHSVRKGQVVARLDTRELELQRERARAALAQALARAGLSPGEESATTDSSPAIRQATAQLEDARFKYENATKLFKSGDISADRFQELEKQLQTRQATLDSARDELRTQLAAIRALRVEVKLAEKSINDATMRAPFDGAVTARLASPGQFLKENTPVLTILKAEPLRLRVDVPEPAAPFVRAGTALTFTSDAAPGASFRAVVRQINPSLDASSRSLSVEARL